MNKDQLKELEKDALAELAKIRAKMSFLDRRDVRNKVIFVLVAGAVLTWLILQTP